MTVLSIRTLGDPILRTPADPVATFDRALRGLVRDMIDTMAQARGVGLAAPQVGVGLQVFVFDTGPAPVPRESGHVVNPMLELVDPDDAVVGEEGCLSIPGQHFDRARARSARVRGMDVRGRPLVVESEGLLARCLQHEVDHLRGELFVDRLTGDSRRQARRALREELAAG